jgi:hypothetical protein
MIRNELLKTALGLGVFCALVSCTSVQTVSEYSGGPLPRPDRVLVSDFAVSPEEVKLDGGISARAFAAAKGTSRTEQEMEIGRKVASSLSEQLVKEIRKLGLSAERAMGTPPQEGDDLVIEGHFLSIDEGNRTERAVIGLGMGRTDVQAEVQIYQNARLVEQFETEAKSGRKPGMAETMGVGAAAGTLATTAVVSAAAAVGSEAFSANVEADASRTAKKLAQQLAVFFVRQG